MPIFRVNPEMIAFMSGAPTSDAIRVSAGLYWAEWYMFLCQPGLEDWQPGGKEARAYVMLMLKRLDAAAHGAVWDGSGL